MSRFCLLNVLLFVCLQLGAQAKPSLQIVPAASVNDYIRSLRLGAVIDGSPTSFFKKLNAVKVEDGMRLPSNGGAALGWFIHYRAGGLNFSFGPFDSRESLARALEQLQPLMEKLKSQLSGANPTAIFEVYGWSWPKDEPLKIDILGGGAYQELSDDAKAQTIALNALEGIIESGEPEDQADAGKDKNDLLKGVTFTPGQVSRMGKIAEGAKGDNGKKGGDKAGSSGGSGWKGKLPIKASFSKWFSMMVKMLTDYFQVDVLFEKALTLAYVIAPELLDNIANTLANLQHSLTPNAVDKALNSVSDVIGVVYDLYQDLAELKRIVTNPDFQKLLKEMDVDMGKAAKHLFEYSAPFLKGVVLDRLPKEFQSFSKCLGLNNASYVDPSCMLKAGGRLAHTKLAEKIPVIGRFNPDDIERMINGDLSPQDAFLKYAKQEGCRKLTGDYKEGCELVMSGELEKAAVVSGRRAAANALGIDPVILDQGFAVFKDGKFDGSDLREVAKMVGELSDTMLEDIFKDAITLWDRVKKIHSNGGHIGSIKITEAEVIQMLGMVLNHVDKNGKIDEVIGATEDVVRAYEDYQGQVVKRKTINSAAGNGIGYSEAKEMTEGNYPEQQVRKMQDEFESVAAKAAIENGDFSGAVAREAQNENEKRPTYSQKKQATETKKESYKEANDLLELAMKAKEKMRSIAHRRSQKLIMLLEEPEVEKTSMFKQEDWYKWLETRKKETVSGNRDGYPYLYGLSGRRSAWDRRKVYYVNGIQTPYRTLETSTQEISDLLNEPVIGVFSYSEGLIESLQVAQELRESLSGVYPSINTLWQGISLDLLAGNNVLLIAHSRGAIMAKRALDQIETVLQINGKGSAINNLEIVTLGGFSPMEKDKWEVSSSNVFIHVNDFDPVPALYTENSSFFPNGNDIRTIFKRGNLAKYHYINTYLNYLQKHRVR